MESDGGIFIARAPCRDSSWLIAMGDSSLSKYTVLEV